jgi:GTPase Era involved in 16S rRNA processing
MRSGRPSVVEPKETQSMLEDMNRTRLELCDALQEVAALQEKSKQPTLAAETRKRAESLRDHRFRIGILGGMKRGKSTLINVLLGSANDTLAPVSVIPATGVITEFEGVDAGSPTTVEVFTREDTSRSTTIGLDDIRSYATEEGNPGNEKRVERIRIRGNFPLLGSSATLVDTPGNGSIFEEHSLAATQALSMCDVYVLLVSATIPLDRMELDYLRQISERERRQFVVALTKCDELEASDRSAVLQRIRNECRNVGLEAREIIELSAKEALKSSGRSDIEQVHRRTGIKRLVEEMERIIRSESIRQQALATRLREAALDASRYLDRALESIHQDLAIASKSVDEVVAQRAELVVQFKKAQSEFASASSRFKSKWNSMMQQFAASSKGLGGRVEAEVEEWLDAQSGVAGSWKASSGLRAQIARRLGAALSMESQRTQEKAEKLLADFNAEAADARDIPMASLRVGSDTQDKVAGGVAPLVAVGSAVGAAGTILTQIGAVQAAALALSQATAAAQVVTTSQGALAAAWAWLAGTSATSATVAAPAAVTVATGALISTAVTAVIYSGGAVIAGVAATKIAAMVITSRAKGRVAEIVEEASEDAIKHMVGEDRISGSLGEVRDRILEESKQRFDEAREDHEGRLAEIEDAVRGKDPALEARLREREQTVEELVGRLMPISSRLPAGSGGAV